MVLPLFLFCFLNLFSILNIYSLQTTLMAALRETGQDLCVYGYAYERMVQEEDDEGLEAFAENIAFSYSYVKYKVENYCGKEYLEQSPLSYGKGLFTLIPPYCNKEILWIWLYLTGFRHL